MVTSKSTQAGCSHARSGSLNRMLWIFLLLLINSSTPSATLVPSTASTKHRPDAHSSRSIPLQGDKGNSIALEAFEQAKILERDGLLEEASEYYWMAIMRYNKKGSDDRHGSRYSLQTLFEHFIAIYQKMGKIEYGYLKIAKQYITQGMIADAVNHLKKLIQEFPNMLEAYLLMARHGGADNPNEKIKYLMEALRLDPNGYSTNFEVANILWDLRAWDASLSYFEKSYLLNTSCSTSLSTSIYLRSYICKWGSKGEQFAKDMVDVEKLIKRELVQLKKRQVEDITTVTVHPHMAMTYPISPALKLELTKTHSNAEIVLVKQAGLTPTNHTELLEEYLDESKSTGFRIKIGYVSANIKAKTTVYMAQDLMRFHDRTKFEVHVYATTPNDTPYFLKEAMRGVDWREKIRKSVEFFHDCSGWDIRQLSNLILGHGIHILVNWDGYSNNGVRPTGLFPLQSAPIQVAHQEYIATVAADFIQYMITDMIASPPSLEHLYTEKFIWLPQPFLATSMAYLSPHIKPPQLKRKPEDDPKLNGCGGAPASFVYCNFNKHLKFTPDTFRDWLRVLQEVDDSVLCLLENPKDSIPYLSNFISDFDKSLLERVRYLEFIPNPFDNQNRVRQMCDAVLDTPVYNSHTTAADALWAGVPIVGYSNQQDMGGRVVYSILYHMNMTDLLAKNQKEFFHIAVNIGLNKTFYKDARSRLIKSCFSKETSFWNLEMYVKHLEKGFEEIWDNFLKGNSPTHVKVDNLYSSNIQAPRGNKGSKDSSTSDNKTALKRLQQDSEREPSTDINILDSLKSITADLIQLLDSMDEKANQVKRSNGSVNKEEIFVRADGSTVTDSEIEAHTAFMEANFDIEYNDMGKWFSPKKSSNIPSAESTKHIQRALENDVIKKKRLSNPAAKAEDSVDASSKKEKVANKEQHKGNKKSEKKLPRKVKIELTSPPKNEHDLKKPKFGPRTGRVTEELPELFNRDDFVELPAGKR